MVRCGYGLVNPAQATDFVRAVCGVLGNGSRGNAETMLLETAAQETHVGRFIDPTPFGAGRGLFQCDRIAFVDIQQRARIADMDAIKAAWGFDIRRVEHLALDSSPLLAAIFARLFYKLIPDVFPADLHGRAGYWKRFYNTVDGDGTVEQYTANARRFL